MNINFKPNSNFTYYSALVCFLILFVITILALLFGGALLFSWLFNTSLIGGFLIYIIVDMILMYIFTAFAIDYPY